MQIKENDEEMYSLLKEMAEIIQSEQKEDTHTQLEQCNKGKMIHEVSQRQARRKLNQCKTLTQQALRFCESFGLVPEFVQLKRIDNDSPVVIRLTSDQESASSSHQNPTETDYHRVHQALYISDRFAVSDEAYHELSSVSNLPPLHKVKASRLALNTSLDIRRIEGPIPGAYRPFQRHLKMN